VKSKNIRNQKKGKKKQVYSSPTQLALILTMLSCPSLSCRPAPPPHHLTANSSRRQPMPCRRASMPPPQRRPPIAKPSVRTRTNPRIAGPSDVAPSQRPPHAGASTSIGLIPSSCPAVSFPSCDLVVWTV
jgi:hypothetical protein